MIQGTLGDPQDPFKGPAGSKYFYNNTKKSSASFTLVLSRVYCGVSETPHSGSDQFNCSIVSDSLQPHGLQHTSLPITNSRSLLKLMSIESLMPSNHQRGYMTCNDFIALTDNRMYACVFLGFKYFSVLISNSVNIDRNNPHEGPL